MLDEGGLLYFRGVCGGRVKVACTLLYSIFRVGRGLLYFRGCFWGEVLDEKNPFLDGGRNGFLYCFWSDGVGPLLLFRVRGRVWVNYTIE